MKISIFLWLNLIKGLRRRGNGERESGAFLISKKGNKKIEKIVFYDELDPHVFDSGIIDLNGQCYYKLDKILKNFGGEVIADIHTHPIGCSTKQSESDKSHPMCRLKGHIAFIAPNFALKSFLMPNECSAYFYEGSFKWTTFFKNKFPLKVTIL